MYANEISPSARQRLAREGQKGGQGQLARAIRPTDLAVRQFVRLLDFPIHMYAKFTIVNHPGHAADYKRIR